MPNKLKPYKMSEMIEIIDPDFIRDYGIIMGGGDITISGDYDISGYPVIEVPFTDGTIGLFNENGDFLGLK